MASFASSVFSLRLNNITSSASPLPIETLQLLSASSQLPSFDTLIAALNISELYKTTPPSSSTSLPLPRLVLAPMVNPSDATLWKTFSEMHMHELLTLEMVDALAEHILTTLNQVNSTATTLPVVLELGCGSGVLAHHLGIRLCGKATVVGCDDFTNQIPTTTLFDTTETETTCNNVTLVQCSASDALNKYSPTIVLCSWMPSGIDFTEQIRQTEHVQEYLLVGIANTSTCGDEWATWGVVGDDGDDYGLDSDSIPTYEEGHCFVRKNIDSISKWQICRFDSSVCRGFSSTVSFLREGNDR